MLIDSEKLKKYIQGQDTIYFHSLSEFIEKSEVAVKKDKFRQQLICAALQGIVTANPPVIGNPYEAVAISAVKCADAVLKELET